MKDPRDKLIRKRLKIQKDLTSCHDHITRVYNSHMYDLERQEVDQLIEIAKEIERMVRTMDGKF